jgi:hypothetical protein
MGRRGEGAGVYGPFDVVTLGWLAGVAVVFGVAAAARWRESTLPAWKRTLGVGMACYAVAFGLQDLVDAGVVAGGLAETATHVLTVVVLLAGIGLFALALGKQLAADREGRADRG